MLSPILQVSNCMKIRANLRANPCFLLSRSDLPIAEMEFWLAAHWAPGLSAPNFTKSSRFQKN